MGIIIYINLFTNSFLQQMTSYLLALSHINWFENPGLVWSMVLKVWIDISTNLFAVCRVMVPCDLDHEFITHWVSDLFQMFCIRNFYVSDHTTSIWSHRMLLIRQNTNYDLTGDELTIYQIGTHKVYVS